MRRSTILLSLFITGWTMAGGQDSTRNDNPEEGFALMRQVATGGNYEDAKHIGYAILEEEEAYHDVALYLARIHGWQGSFDSAYMVLDRVISMEPELFEAYQTCVDLAYWENRWAKLETCGGRAVELEGDSTEILKKLQLARQHRESQQEGAELFMHYSYDHFSLPYVRNWHMLTVGGQLPFSHGTLIPYLNAGYHAGGSNPSTDLQLNLDAYLTLSKKNYLLAGYGFSPDGETNYLPVHRAALEIWQVLPAGFGISAGLRYFYWESHFPFLTFSAEKYAGNYWFSLRSYLFSKDYGISGSWYVSARRYFATRFDHLTLTLGYGTAPDEPLVVVTDLDRLNALSSRIAFSRKVSPVVRLSIMMGYAYEEYVDQGFRHRFDMRAGCYFRIRK